MSDVKPSNRKNEEDMGPWGIFRVANGETTAEKWAKDQRQVKFNKHGQRSGRKEQQGVE